MLYNAREISKSSIENHMHYLACNSLAGKFSPFNRYCTLDYFYHLKILILKKINFPRRLQNLLIEKYKTFGEMEL